MSNKKSSHLGLWLTLVVVVACLLSALVTNPSKEVHQAKISKAVAAGVGTTVTESMGNTNRFLTQLLGGGAQNIVAIATDMYLDQALQYNNKLLYSTTYIVTTEGEKMLSVGAFGHIYTFSEEEVQNIIKKAIQ